MPNPTRFLDISSKSLSLNREKADLGLSPTSLIALLIGTKAAPAEYWAINSILVNTNLGKANTAVNPVSVIILVSVLKGLKLGILE